VSRRLLAAAGTVGALVAGWQVFIRVQGDSQVAFRADELSEVQAAHGVVHGRIELVNRGRQLSTLRRVDGRIVDGPPGRVLVTRLGSKPHQRGWWVSNLLEPGESCVAEVEIELQAPVTGPVVIELDAEDIGRGLAAHRTARIRVPVPEVVA
jgi:hypothetical protein